MSIGKRIITSLPTTRGEFYCDQLFISAHCGYCRDDEGERIDWPCETIAILDGEA